MLPDGRDNTVPPEPCTTGGILMAHLFVIGGITLLRCQSKYRLARQIARASSSALCGIADSKKMSSLISNVR